LIDDADKAYAKREAELEELAGEGAMRQLERNVLLNVIDRKWREHLYEMDYLKEGIGLRAMAQRDPLVEYQREGFDMFTGMLEGLKEESVGFLFNVQVEAAPAAAAVAPVAAPEGLAEFAQKAAARARTDTAGARDATVPDEAPAPEAPATGRPRHAAPAGLRAKGIDDGESARALTFSGPSEDGSTEVQRRNAGAGPSKSAQPAAPSEGGTRRERREAARREAKASRKS
jgi:preprotein translocase subunit SecA